MNESEAIKIINSVLKKKELKSLTTIESIILEESWKGKNGERYEDIANKYKYDSKTINTYAYNLWKRLSEAFTLKESNRINRKNIKLVIEQYSQKIRLEKSSINNHKNQEEIFTDKSSFSLSRSESKISKYKRAFELRQAAKNLENRKEFSYLIESFKIYQQLNHIDQAVDVLSQIVSTPWQRDESIGQIAYRLGFLSEMRDALGWIIRKIENNHNLPASIVTRLYNEYGDLIWMTTNENELAISYHKKSQEWYLNYPRNEFIRDFFIAGEFNKAFCNIDLRKLEEAQKNLISGYKHIRIHSQQPEHLLYETSLDCLSAYLKSLESKDKSEIKYWAEKAYQKVINPEIFRALRIWGMNHYPTYLARAFQKIGDYERSFQMYMKSNSVAIPSQCIQAESKNLVGKANLIYLENRKNIPDTVISHLIKARNKLKTIKTEGDIAEVNLQLGFIFRESGKLEKSEEYLSESESFYKKRNVFIQINRVQQVRDGASYFDIF